MKLTQLLILFLFLSIKGFSQQAVLTSSGDKVTLNYLSSSGGTITGSITVNGATTLSGTLTIGDKLFPTSFGGDGYALTISGTNMVWAASSGIPYTGATQAVNLGNFDMKVNGLTIGRGANNSEYNTVLGLNALNSLTPGAANTAIGAYTLSVNTGGDNTAVGNEALRKNTSGLENLALGTMALTNNTTGIKNVASGISALVANVVGDENVAMGNFSLSLNTSGYRNTALGHQALNTNTTGNYNTAIGHDADVSSNNLSNATAIGYGAIATASNTIQLGNNSVTEVITNGKLTVQNITIGQGKSNIGTNTVMGNGSLSVNTTGFENTAVGYEAMKLNTTGNYNTAIGMIALSKNTTGNLNTAIGYNSLGNNSTGEGNTAIGKYAGQLLTSGNNNTIIGTGADVYLNNLVNATAIGFGANVMASNTIQLGNGDITNVNTSGTITAGSVTYPKDHGSAGKVLSTTGSGTLIWIDLPYASPQPFAFGPNKTLNANEVTANLVNISSDLRLKRNIKPISNSIDQILKLNPVSYDKKQNLNSSEYSIKENGFIAQELRKVFPDLVKEGTDKDKLLSVNYTALIPVLTKSIQEQQKQIQEQNKKIEKLQALVEQLINKKK